MNDVFQTQLNVIFQNTFAVFVMNTETIEYINTIIYILIAKPVSQKELISIVKRNIKKIVYFDL
jgi:hypothetical protein